MQSNKKRKFFNSAKKRLPEHVPISKETAFSEVYTEKKLKLSQGSSQNRFALRFHGDKYKQFYDSHRDNRSQDHYESSFTFLRNIKHHLRQENGKIIYANEAIQTNRPHSVEPVDLNRIALPEIINQSLKGKILAGAPLTGKPIKKEKSIDLFLMN